MNFLHSENGFILAATLWILTAIVLATGLFALWTHHATEVVLREQEDVQGEIDLSSTRSALLYLLATQRMTLAGLTIPQAEAQDRQEKKNINPLGISVMPAGREIALDDRVYQGTGSACFSLQDEGGLTGLNYFFSPQLEKLLGLYGVPAPQRAPLTDKLMDYTDKDDLHRLNGAEAGDYERQGLPLPPNRPLLTSWEVRNVMGWENYPGLWKGNPLPRLTTVASGGMPNLNTAPKTILKTITGIDDEIAERIIAAREDKPFSSIRDISRAAGRPLNLSPLGHSFLPSARLRLTLWHKGGQLGREVHVRLTPRADKQAPWTIDYELSVPLTPSQKQVDKILLPGESFFLIITDLGEAPLLD
ncbi:type II secretion system protein GspK [Desulfococcaceae bacterium HSG8]|nr:type II secretion system protein GspK [Desulfococcaceae bacterium HSG8]